MNVVSTENGFEETFWQTVNQDPIHYYFFILDWKQRKDKTKIFLAMDGKNVQGLMLVYADHIVQLRGTREAVEQLLDTVDLERVELQAPLECEAIVTRKYNPQVRYELVLMSMKRGEESIQIKNRPVRLGVMDAEAVGEIMRKADPAWWGEVTTETQKESLANAFWLGIKDYQKLVSVGSTRFVDFASNIGVVATEEGYRNRGHATSIVSALVQEIFKTSPVALIHVLSDNAPAVRVYSKVGFRPYKRYLLIRGEKVEV